MDEPLLDPDVAAARIAKASRPLFPERVPVTQALGRTLAEALSSPMALPPFGRAAMDGYAVRFQDPWSPLVVTGVTRAGDAPRSLSPGTAVRIFTGAPLPDGADTVIEQEACRLESGSCLHIEIPGFLGRNVMSRGHEVVPGATIASAGTRLSAYHLSLLTALGIEHVAVIKRPRVAVIQTGDELEEAGRALGPGKIYASNGVLIGALVEEWGGRLTGISQVPDALQAVVEALLREAARSDLIVVTGGVSVGDFDFVPEALERAGRRLFWGVSMHPGRAMAAGVAADTPVVALSGNPGAAVVSWVRVVSPMWAAWHGGRLVERSMRLPLREGFAKPSRETRYVPVRILEGVAVSDLPQGADVVTAFVDADAFAVLPAGSGPLAAGVSVEIWEPGGIGGRHPRWVGNTP